jgi:5-bromo-4-chloroindolyl phosphate hydrolysis protein
MRQIVASGVGGGLALTLAVFQFDLPLLVALGIGGGVYAGLSALFANISAADALPVAEGLSRGEAERIIKEGERKVATIRRLRRQIVDRQVGKQVDAICAVADRVFLNLRSDPRGVKAAQRFLEYYLDATVLVIHRYVGLSKHAAGNPEVQKAIFSFAEVLNLIQATFAKQYERLLRDGVLDFDTELSVLKQMIRTEGL